MEATVTGAKAMRKWTAVIIFNPHSAKPEQVQASLDQYTTWNGCPDLLDETFKAALREAGEALRAGLAEDACVVVCKQLTNDPAPKRDRDWYVYRDERGRVLAQR